MDIENLIRTIPDFPEKGIMFRDVTTLFSHPEGFRSAIAQFKSAWADHSIDFIAGIDARGFIIGGALAVDLGVGFIPLRKKGKLPFETITQSYDLEYGSAELEVHIDACKSGDRVLLVDDLIATGGTAEAAVSLLRQLDAFVVGASFLVDLPDLGGADKLRANDVAVNSLCSFEGH